MLPAICVQAQGGLLRNATVSQLRFRMPVLLPAAVGSYMHAVLAASAQDTVRRMAAVESVEAFSFVFWYVRGPGCLGRDCDRFWRGNNRCRSDRCVIIATAVTVPR